MSDTHITLHGWVGNEVAHRDVNGISVVNFRVASTPRIKRKGQWQDGDTTWYSVSAWRSLADNINDSVKKGDAVVVSGRLRTEAWTREDGQVSTSLVVEATLVGHDLRRGTSVFLRSSRQDKEGDVHDEAADMVHSAPDETPQVDSWGSVFDTDGSDDDTEEPAA
jgi:single-strand DNA-binding protein